MDETIKTTGTGTSGGSPAVWDHLTSRLKIFAVVYLALMAAGLVMVVVIPSRYRAQAVLQILTVKEERRELTELDKESLHNAVISDAVLESAAERLRETGEAGSGGEYGTVRALRRSMMVDFDAAKGQVLVRAENGNPDQAATYANAVAGAYVEREKVRAESERKAFEPDLTRLAELKEVLSAKESALHKTEEALLAFDEESRSTLKSAELAKEREDLEQKVRQTRTNLEIVETQVKSLVVSEENLKRELAATPEFLELPEKTIAPNPERAAMLADIAKEERELSEMLKRYTERHPEVIEKRAIIAQKKSDLSKLAERVSDTERRAQQPKPVYLQVKQNHDQAKMRLEEAQTRVVQQKDQVKQYEDRLGLVEERVRQRAQMETEAARVGREVADVKKEMSEREDRVSRLERLLVVPKVGEEAVRPTLPSGPERGWWTAVVFLTAVGGATAGTFVAGVLGRSVESVWDIERQLKLPVLGKVSSIDEAQRRKRRWAGRRLKAFTTLLLAAGAVLVVLLFVFEAQIHALRMFLFGN